MNRYVLIPEDTLRILPPEDGAGAAIEIFCSRYINHRSQISRNRGIRAIK